MKRTILKIAAPLIAIFTLMIGLRVGAGEAVRAAVVFGAPIGRPAPNGKTRLAWQVLTFLDDRGVKETIPMQGLSVIANVKGQEQRWLGASNKDGVAEVFFELEGLAFGDPVHLEVRLEGEKEPLAAGFVKWGEPHEDHDVLTATAAAARPTVRSGAVGLDVVVEGERLIAGFPTSVWVRATPPAGMSAAGIAIDVDPEPGLLTARNRVTTCASGWAELPLTAQAHVVGASFLTGGANGGSNGGANGGKWFGALPVAAGAFFISMPRSLPAAERASAVLIAPNPRDVVYAELDDTRGRIAAAALDVKVEEGDPTPRARFELPMLSGGLYWVVVSGEPRGAEHMAGAAVAKAFVVGDGSAGLSRDGAPVVNMHDACSLGPWVAQRPAPGFPRWVALDGLPARSAANRFRHRLGLGIGLVSLLAAGILETLLLMAAARESRIALQLAELDEDDGSAEKVTAKAPGGGLVTALLVAVLGFALLAVLLIAKA
jgi:hypothetical protein